MKNVMNGLSMGLLLSVTASVAYGADTSDQEFLARAIRHNQLELRLGHMAAERASTPEVKAVGETMVKNHSELEKQLEELTQKAGVSVNPELSSEQRAVITRLESISGTAFDRDFKQTLNDIHVRELAMYQDEVNRAQDPKLRTLAKKRVTKLEVTVKQAGKTEEPAAKGW